MTFQNPSRRTALFALPAVAAAPLAIPTDASAADQIDPVFAARDAWKEAERQYYDAEERAGIAAGDQRVAIPTATGGTRYAATPEAIDKAIDEERRWQIFNCAEWETGSWEAERLTEAERAAAKAWTAPDAEALKADLAERKARKAAAMEAENVEALDRADMDALRAYLATPATTAAGVASKLRDSDYREDGEVAAALADLDRMAGQGDQIAAQGRQAPPTHHQGQTEVERLHARYIEALRVAEAAQDDDELTRLNAIANGIEKEMAEAEPITPRDVALVTLATGGEYLEGNGEPLQRLVAMLERVAGQGTTA